MRQHPGSGRHQLRRVGGHCAAPRDLVGVQAAGALGRRIGSHLVERPAEVDGGRPCGGEHLGRGIEVIPAGGGECEPVGGGDSDRRCAAHGERADRLGDLGRCLAAQLDRLVRQATLVDHDHCILFEAHDALWLELGHRFEPAASL